MTVWTSHTLHYENQAISQMKSFHKKIKKLISNAIDHLRDVLEKFKIYLTWQNFNIWIEIERIWFRYQVNHLIDIFQNCHSSIFSFALNEMISHIKHYNLNTQTCLKLCTSHFKVSMRLFCTHTVQKRMRTEASLSLENFNSHWLLTVE